MNKKGSLNNICFIPAKGNSRRLTRKNILSVGGEPLVLRAIESALESGCFNRVCVSSNDKEILELAHSAGAESLERSEKMCVHGVTAKEVVWTHLKEMSQDFDFVSMLMPTTPLRKARHIEEAYELISDNKASTLVSVCEYEESLGSAMKMKNGKLEPYYVPKDGLINEEDNNSKGYHFNGAVYIAQYDYFMEHASFFDERTVPYVMDRVSSIDVNTMDDLNMAKAYANYFINKQTSINLE